MTINKGYSQRQDANRRAAREDLKLVHSYGGSKLDESRAVISAGLGGTKNHEFGELMSKGAEPQPDPGAANRLAHVGMDGAPNVYEEKYQGRMNGRGKRVL